MSYQEPLGATEGVRWTMTKQGLQDGASQKGTTTDSRHRPIRRSSFHPERRKGWEHRDGAFKKDTTSTDATTDCQKLGK